MISAVGTFATLSGRPLLCPPWASSGWPVGCTAWAPRSSPRCPRWPSPPGRSTSARASRTPTGRARSSRPPSTALRSGAATSTRPARASPNCARAIAEHGRRFYGLDYDPDTEVLVTTGATEAIAAAVLGLVEPGRRGHRARALLRLLRREHRDGRRGRRVPVTLRAPDFRLDVDALRRAVTAAHPRDPAEHPAQPDRDGPRPRRARRRSPRSPSSTTWS